MLEFDVSDDDLARTRFGFSVLHEVTASLRVLADPAAHAMHLPWIREVAPRVARLDLPQLRCLVPATGYFPDFIAPPPHTPLPELAVELAAVRATAPEQVRRELAEAYGGDPPPEVAALLADPESALPTLTAELALYFETALGGRWPSIRALLEADIADRARHLALHGPRRTLTELHPAVGFDRRGRLTLAITYDAPVALDGRGLLLMPSVFAWPSIYAVTDPPWQPTLIYPARGVATAWEPVAPPRIDALARVLGASRTALLRALDVPRTGAELAQILEVTPGAVSQHVGVLRDAGLLASRRDGRSQICTRTALGDRLLS